MCNKINEVFKDILFCYLVCKITFFFSPLFTHYNLISLSNFFKPSSIFIKHYSNMDPFNPNNPNVPNNKNNPNVFSVPGYYPMMELNPFDQFSANAFAAFQNSPNVFASTQSQVIKQLMMRNPFNVQPVQPEQPSQPIRSEPDEDVEVVPKTQPQTNKRKKGKKTSPRRIKVDFF
ncbi:hypothetical protein HanPI659440_Chr06g0225401 [Helianthus annuus]|nr:hypothetical protein HanPI659440_Chr06g0225401 [Helianthus annuus]